MAGLTNDLPTVAQICDLVEVTGYCGNCGRQMPVLIPRYMENNWIPCEMRASCGLCVPAATPAKVAAKAPAADGAGAIPASFRDWNPLYGNVPLCDYIWNNCDANLMIVGDFDTGKTWSTCKIAQEIAKTNKPVRFWKYSELLRKLGDAAKTDAKYRCFTRQLKQPGLLIIDDFGAKTATPPQLDAVYDLLSESRNTSPLIIWITMNCSLGDYHDQHNRSIQSGRICARLEKFLFVHSVYLDKEPPREHPTLNI